MSGRWFGAATLGVLAGAGVVIVVELAGYFLYQRLWGDSAVALGLIIAVSGIAGLYAGWILGMVIFSAIRGSQNGGEAA